MATQWKQKKQQRNPGGNNGARVRPDLRFTIYTMQGFKCMYCGKSLANAKRDNIHLDHLICQSFGGSNDPHNLIMSCHKCNTSRGNENWKAFAYGKKGATRRIRNWIVKMQTEEGVQEFKCTRKVIKKWMHLIIGRTTPIAIARKMK